MLAVSSDRGETWSEPRPVDPSAAQGVHQFLPAVAVNREGVLGISYFSSRGFEDLEGPEGGYHQRFTASVDGGETFFPSKRISSRPSRPASAERHDRLVLMPIHDGERQVFHLGFLSAHGRWPMGGDYMGLAADAAGDFHPFWTDSRHGSFQVFTSTVRMETGPAIESPADDGGEVAEVRDVTGWVELVAGAVAWNPENRPATWPSASSPPWALAPASTGPRPAI